MRHQWFECKHRYLREKNEITQNFCPIDGTTLTESSKRSQAVYDCTLELGCVARHCRVMALKMTPLQNIYPRFQLHGLYLQSNTLRLIETSWIFCTWLRQKVVMREIRNFPFSEEMQLSAAAALGKSSSSERTLMLSTKAYRLGQCAVIIYLSSFLYRCSQFEDLFSNVLFNYQWLYAKMSACPLQAVLSDFEDACGHVTDKDARSGSNPAAHFPTPALCI